MKTVARNTVIAAAVAAALASISPVATAATTLACRTNHYRIAVGSTAVYDDPGQHYIKTKYFDQVVTGPNSNVEPIDSGGWRKVYVSSGLTADGKGWIWADHLTYRFCD